MEAGEFFEAKDLGRSEDGGLPRRIGHGDFDGGVFFIAFLAAETEAAFGNVVALDDFFVHVIDADTSGEIDAGANVAATVHFATTGKSWRRESWWFRRGFRFGGQRGRGAGVGAGRNDIAKNRGGGVSGARRHERRGCGRSNREKGRRFVCRI